MTIIFASLFFAAGALGTNYLISQNNSTSAAGYLTYVYNHGALLDLSASAALLGIILFLIALPALVFLMKDKNAGYALTGGTLGLAGAITYFANAGSFFFFVDRASAYAQCTSCIQLAYTEALGSQSFIYGFQLAYLLISMAIGILSLVVKSAGYRPVRITGLATAVFGIFESVGFIAAGTFFDSSVYDVGIKTVVNDMIFIVGVLALILFVFWALIIGRKLRNLTARSSHQ